MKEKLVHTVIAASVGAVFGAIAVFLLTGREKFDSLVVENLTITGQARLVDKSGKESLLLKDGSVLAGNMVLGKNFVGTQFQGQVFVGNRLYTSPDDLVATPVEQWHFYTEIGGSPESGGEMVIRSPNGPNVVGKPIVGGIMLRAGFDKDDRPQMFAQVNQSGDRLPVPFSIPEILMPEEHRTIAADPVEKTQ